MNRHRFVRNRELAQCEREHEQHRLTENPSSLFFLSRMLIFNRFDECLSERTKIGMRLKHIAFRFRSQHLAHADDALDLCTSLLSFLLYTLTQIHRQHEHIHIIHSHHYNRLMLSSGSVFFCVLLLHTLR